MGFFAYEIDIDKDVLLNKDVNLDIDKFVDVDVNIDGLLADAEAAADVTGGSAGGGGGQMELFLIDSYDDEEGPLDVL